jgi:hypothetical protein
MSADVLEANILEYEMPGFSAPESSSAHQSQMDCNRLSLDYLRLLVQSNQFATSNVAQFESPYFIIPKQPSQNVPKSTETENDKIAKEFVGRAERWKRVTSFQSSLASKFMHEDYQAIMVMGAPVIPMILKRLKKSPEHWFWALKFLAKKDVGEGTERPSDAAKAWLNWGKENGYIS